MALPPIIFTSQHVTLYSPEDPAIDREKTSPERWVQYNECVDLDIATIDVVDGQSPTEFDIRALSPAEYDVVGCLVYAPNEEASGADADQRSALNFVETLLHALRIGLVEVRGIDGWGDGAKRCRINGSAREGWTEDTISAIPGPTRLFLGLAILSLSRMDEKKSRDVADLQSVTVEPSAEDGRAARRIAAV